MTSTEFPLQTGVINSVQITKNSDGSQNVRLSIQTHAGYGIIPNVPLETPLGAQYIPIVGQQVLFERTEIANGIGFQTKILGVYGSRPFDAPIQPGEYLIEGLGGSFAWFGNGGDVEISDDVMGNVIKLLSKIGILMVGDALSINVKGIGQINILPANVITGEKEKIEFVKLTTGAVQTPLSPTITITNDEIKVNNAKVALGNTNDSVIGGAVVSRSDVVGDYSFDIFTGRPIPKSGTVTSTIFPTTTTP